MTTIAAVLGGLVLFDVAVLAVVVWLARRRDRQFSRLSACCHAAVLGGRCARCGHLDGDIVTLNRLRGNL